MLYQNAIKIVSVIVIINIKRIDCHLKDMGEVTNWKEIIKEMEYRIVGGKPVPLEQYPFNVQILNLGGLCGGTILSRKTVLTAAHCFDYNTNIAEMRVFSNSRYIFDRMARVHEVWEFIKHENYNQSALFSNDIAIIIIHDKFIPSATVQAASLCNTNEWMKESETQFEASGWGETKYGEGNSKQGLLKTHLRYIPDKNCSKINKVKLSRGMFCLYGDGVRDTCRGDSGGGIVWKGTIVGIVSHGNGCAKTPAMYTNVYYFLSWIRDTVTKLHRKYCHFHEHLKG